MEDIKVPAIPLTSAPSVYLYGYIPYNIFYMTYNFIWLFYASFFPCLFISFLVIYFAIHLHIFFRAIAMAVLIIISIWNLTGVLAVPLPWASNNPVAIQCAWNLDPSVHWNATGEIIVGSQCFSSVLPVVFQWPSSCVPVCSNYAN